MTLLLNGSVKIVEAKVRETGDNGKLVVQSVDGDTSWTLYQSHLNHIIFRTREEAEEVEKASRETTNCFNQ